MTHDFLLPLIKTALSEDIGAGDVTSELLIGADATANMRFVARQALVVAGGFVPQMVYAELDKDVRVAVIAREGAMLKAGEVIATVKGPARAILTGERTALNIMQRMSAVATITRAYVDAVAGTGAKILDTRKTMPGLRLADKYAVRAGGGENHRMGLYDAVMVKDNHLAEAGIGMAQMVQKVREQKPGMPIYVECDTLAQVREALGAQPDRIMLDNMPPDELREAVRICGGKVKLEATGGVTLENVRAIAQTGVDYISTGAITHSAPNVDIGLDVI